MASVLESLLDVASVAPTFFREESARSGQPPSTLDNELRLKWILKMTDMNGISFGSKFEEKPRGDRASRARRMRMVATALLFVTGVAGFISVGRSNEPSRQGTINGGHYWKDVSVGANHMLGIDQSGNAWAWGENDRGQLGDGTTPTHTAPAMVSGGGYIFKSIEAGDSFSVGLDTADKIWTWGGEITITNWAKVMPRFTSG